jgi:hypothetical protein
MKYSGSNSKGIDSTSASTGGGSGVGSSSGLYGLSSSLLYPATAASGNAATARSDDSVDYDDAEDSSAAPSATSTTGSPVGSTKVHISKHSIDRQSSTHNSMRLTAKPHPFTGAVLSPKHALELTPALCLQITSTLAGDYHKSVVPYTVWITDAWRVLGWAEPSAALFWELATMYNALAAAGRELAYQHDRAGMMIPPILSCGSTSSLGSGATNSHQTPNDHSHRNSIEKKKMSSVASAKELPLWLVGTFLLLHCEELAYLRNLSGQDERRFFGTGSPPGSSANASPAASTPFASPLVSSPFVLTMLGTNQLEFPGFFKNPSLSPRYVQVCRLVRSAPMHAHLFPLD